MKKHNRIFIWAGILMLAALLVMGCGKKPVVLPDPGPSQAYLDSLEQVRVDSLAEVARLAREAEEAERRVREEAERLAREAEQSAKSSLKVIYFDFDKSNLNKGARSAVEFNAGVLAQFKNWSVLIEGHCDERGTDEYNLALGERRAKTVMDFFTSYGISGARLSNVSYGEERPAATGHNEDAWSKNRRAVLVVK
ncbi:peptidoglycan-associated lipoprotein Pal [bacterium]|nr:peptidoglycan-associated lipoprotein Pal [bacterium]MBU1651157.1 peptidoglycan-associated lipoprotein Pal [bacterium]MBU1880858.1 peptidoglycan-associated lipoprotein Pal [bacterium]